MCPKKNGLLAKRRHGQRIRQQYTVRTFKSEDQTVMLWREFSSRGSTPLIGTVGSFDSDMYRITVDDHTIPFIHGIHCRTDGFLIKKTMVDLRR